MRVLYIGQYRAGSTSRMRGENLRAILNPSSFEVIDTDQPILETRQPFRSIGWRFIRGPLIGNVERYIRKGINGHYDLVWVDKGVFMGGGLLSEIPAGIKVHYTPDTGVIYNRSRLFFECIPLYDHCITTKSFELEAYVQKGARSVLFCTQGYDSRIHRPVQQSQDKEGVVFIGLCEEEREYIIGKLLERQVSVKLAGPNWEKFARRHQHQRHLSFLGPGVFGDAYAALISGSQLGLGLLSRRFPERHTTRTLEMPACGTALVTERNEDTRSIFQEGDVFFYNGTEELIEMVPKILKDRQTLDRVTQAGYRRVTEGGYDYLTILRRLLSEMNVYAE